MYSYGVEWLGKNGEMHNMMSDSSFMSYDAAYADSVRFLKEAKIKTGNIEIYYGKFLLDEIFVNVP